MSFPEVLLVLLLFPSLIVSMVVNFFVVGEKNVVKTVINWSKLFSFFFSKFYLCHFLYCNCCTARKRMFFDFVFLFFLCSVIFPAIETVYTLTFNVFYVFLIRCWSHSGHVFSVSVFDSSGPTKHLYGLGTLSLLCPVVARKQADCTWLYRQSYFMIH